MVTSETHLTDYFLSAATIQSNQIAVIYHTNSFAVDNNIINLLSVIQVLWTVLYDKLSEIAFHFNGLKLLEYRTKPNTK